MGVAEMRDVTEIVARVRTQKSGGGLVSSRDRGSGQGTQVRDQLPRYVIRT